LKKISLALFVLAGIAMMSSCGMTNTPHRLHNTPNAIRDDRVNNHRDGLLNNRNEGHNRRHDEHRNNKHKPQNGQHNNGLTRYNENHNRQGFLSKLFNNRNEHNRNGVRNGNHSVTTNFNHNRANELTSKVKDIEGIENAVVTMNGNTALVGINLKEGYDEKDIAGLKTQVRHAIKNADSNIEHIGVTTAPEVITRMNNSHEKVNNGEHRENKNAGNMLPNVMPTV